MGGAGDGCGGMENLNGAAARRTGTGAIRQECLMHSRLSAPQAQGMKPFACPVLRAAAPLRFSHTPADAPRPSHAACSSLLSGCFKNRLWVAAVRAMGLCTSNNCIFSCKVIVNNHPIKNQSRVFSQPLVKSRK